jgi:3'-phosphoadenosine 5'-phosphosulfate (PAPS) 3'-phosphatase
MAKKTHDPQVLSQSPKALLAMVKKVEILAHRVGQAIIMPDYHNRNYTKEIKSDGSPVLSTDLKSSAALEAALPAILNVPVVSEENDIAAAPCHWAIDPLDGTAEFVDETDPKSPFYKSESGKFSSTGHGGFSIKIHLAFQGAVILGVVHAPVQNMTFSSIEGGPSWMRKGLGQRRIIAVQGPQNDLFGTEGLRVVFNAKSNPQETYDRARHDFAQRGVYIGDYPLTRPGLPRNLQILLGGVDIHLGRDGYGWDLGADALIVRNAGGALFSMTTGHDLRFDTPRVLGGPYLAARDASLREKLFPALEKN